MQNTASSPSSRLARLIEVERTAISAARVALAIAEADLNGLIARYAGSRSAEDAQAICWAQVKMLEARQTMDHARSLAILSIGEQARVEAAA